MNYLSICSGIEAATVAWHPLGWRPLAFSEIEPFPSAVLAHHWPDVPNLGDMTLYHDWPSSLRPDFIVGGTPCQAFSVAGLRRGLEDPRGNLTLVFLGLLERFRPQWVVWENVPGVLSDNTGAFGAFLGGLGELGYGFAYRVLDAQYYGVPQRRRRVFVVGCLGDWRRAAAVLFEPESLRGDSPPCRTQREGIAVCPTLRAGGNSTGGNRPPGTDVDTCGSLIPAVARSLNAYPGRSDGESETFIAHALRSEGFDASEDGTGRGTPLVPVAFQPGNLRRGSGSPPNEETFPTLKADHGRGMSDQSPCVAFAQNQLGEIRIGHVTNTINTNSNASGRNTPMINHLTAVRRLTPTECERLQGFPDGHTLIPWRGKMAPDGPRYKALGNSMAVPVMRWIGHRIHSLTVSNSTTNHVAP